MLTEFKQFILRGNVIGLAVAVVIGAAFGAIVTSLVKISSPRSLRHLRPARLFRPEFHTQWQRNPRPGLSQRVDRVSDHRDGDLLRGGQTDECADDPDAHQPTPDPLTGKCPLCLSEVQLGASRCPFCTQEITAVAA